MSYRNEPGRHKRPADFFRLRLFTEAEMTERIERIRLEDAPALCPTCGSTTPEVIERKVCLGACGRELPLSMFYRERRTRDGRCSQCKDCRRPANIESARRRRLRECRKERAS